MSSSSCDSLYILTLPEVTFNISSYSGEIFPGLTDEYILQEISNLSVDYESIRHEAERVKLPYLLEYLTQVDIPNTFKNLSYYRQRVEESKDNWTEFFKYMEKIKGVIGMFSYNDPENNTTIYIVVISTWVPIDEGIQILSPYNIEVKEDRHGACIILGDEAMREFNTQLFLTHCLVDPFSQREGIECFNGGLKLNPYQQNIAELLESERSHDVELSRSDLMEVLKYQRRRYNLIQAILRGDDSIEGVQLESDQLNVLEHILQYDSDMIIAFYGRDRHYIYIDCDNSQQKDVFIDLLKGILPEVYPSDHNNVSMSIRGAGPPTVTGYNILEGKFCKPYGIRALIRYIQSVHSPITPARMSLDNESRHNINDILKGHGSTLNV